jgi:hypothetical protein
MTFLSDPCQDLAGHFSGFPPPGTADGHMTAVVVVPSENKLMRLLKNGKLCLSRVM